jgi:hypothetical protein
MVNHSLSSINGAELSPLKKGRVRDIKFRGGKMNNRGSLMELMPNLLIFFMVLATLVALLPGMSSLLENAQNSQSLNCVGYTYNGQPGNVLSYNSTIGSRSTIGCLALQLYIPYIVLGVLIGGVGYILYGRSMGGQDSGY